MAVSLCSTAYDVLDSSGTQNGTQSVTVPTDCTAIIAMMSKYQGSQLITDIDWNGTEAFTELINVPGNGGAQGYCLFTLANPTTGTHDMTWDWDVWNPITFGGDIVLFFVKDASITAGEVDKTDFDSHALSSGTASITLTSTTSDLVLGLGHNIFNDPTVNYDTLVVDLSAGNDNAIAGAWDGATFVTMTESASGYSTIIGISLIDGAAGGEIFERILNEEISVADNGDRYADAIRTALDSISMLDSVEATSITPAIGRSLLATRVEVIYNRN